GSRRCPLWGCLSCVLGSFLQATFRALCGLAQVDAGGLTPQASFATRVPSPPIQLRQREGAALLARPTKISPLLDLRYQAEYVGLRFLIGLVRLLPLDISCAISAKMWRWVGARTRCPTRALSQRTRAVPA